MVLCRVNKIQILLYLQKAGSLQNQTTGTKYTFIYSFKPSETMLNTNNKKGKEWAETSVRKCFEGRGDFNSNSFLNELWFL